MRLVLGQFDVSMQDSSWLDDTFDVRSKHLPRLRNQRLPAILFLLGQCRNDLQDVGDQGGSLGGGFLAQPGIGGSKDGSDMAAHGPAQWPAALDDAGNGAGARDRRIAGLPQRAAAAMYLLVPRYRSGFWNPGVLYLAPTGLYLSKGQMVDASNGSAVRVVKFGGGISRWPAFWAIGLAHSGRPCSGSPPDADAIIGRSQIVQEF
jgi:hypothetical protein